MALVTALPQTAPLKRGHNQLLGPGLCHRFHGRPAAGDLPVKIRAGNKIKAVNDLFPLLQQKFFCLRIPVDLIGIRVGLPIIDIDIGSVPEQDCPWHHLPGRTAMEPDPEGFQLPEAVVRLLQTVQGLL